ncbi:MAG: purine-binding chemotaxis protein CheW [Caldisericaceae bacterium]|nr:purine-binding chemotaxis protein CheW [Caldisericaceae bacterium]
MTESEDLMTSEDTQKDKYLSFNLGNSEYAIPIHYVLEIIGLQPITRVPDVPNYVKGVINIRGKVIPVVDLRQRFGLEEQAYDDRTCIIIVRIEEMQVGLIVDTVNEVLKIESQQIEPPPEVKRGQANKFIDGLAKVADSVKIVLNMASILEISEGEQSKAVAEIEAS